MLVTEDIVRKETLSSHKGILWQSKHGQYRRFWFALDLRSFTQLCWNEAVYGPCRRIRCLILVPSEIDRRAMKCAVGLVHMMQHIDQSNNNRDHKILYSVDLPHIELFVSEFCGRNKWKSQSDPNSVLPPKIIDPSGSTFCKATGSLLYL
jgi:hypothetical protein